MLAILGIVAVFVAVLGGFLLEKGNLYVLFQPAELLIVGGAAVGIIMVANTPAGMRRMARGVLAAFRPPRRTHQKTILKTPKAAASSAITPNSWPTGSRANSSAIRCAC